MVHLSPARVGPLGRTQSGYGIDGEMDGGSEAGETLVSVLNGWLDVEHRRDRIISLGSGRCTIRTAEATDPDSRKRSLSAGGSSGVRGDFWSRHPMVERGKAPSRAQNVPFDVGLRLHRLMSAAELRASFSRSFMIPLDMPLSPRSALAVSPMKSSSCGRDYGIPKRLYREVSLGHTVQPWRQERVVVQETP
jgi:hypothetical protein